MSGGLEHLTRKAIGSASCVGLLTMPACDDYAFFDSGRALQRLWLAATKLGIAVQPIATPTFLFARLQMQDTGLDDGSAAELRTLRMRFESLFPVVDDQCGEVLLLRITKAGDLRARALRRPVTDVLIFDDRENESDNHDRSSGDAP